MLKCSTSRDDGSPCSNPVCAEDRRPIGESECAQHYVKTLVAENPERLAERMRAWALEQGMRVGPMVGTFNIPKAIEELITVLGIDSYKTTIAGQPVTVTPAKVYDPTLDQQTVVTTTVVPAAIFDAGYEARDAYVGLSDRCTAAENALALALEERDAWYNDAQDWQAKFVCAEAASVFRVVFNDDPEITCIYCKSNKDRCEHALVFRDKASTVWMGVHEKCIPEMMRGGRS